MSQSKRTQIELLIDKAADAHASKDALCFSQAACDAANAMISLGNAESLESQQIQKRG